MIQDIGPKHLNNHYEKKYPAPKDKVMLFKDKMIFVKEIHNEAQFLSYEEFTAICEKMNRTVPECTYIFTLGEDAYFLVEMEEMETEGYEYRKMFDLRRMHPKEAVFAGATAWHLYQWYHTNRFCGVCGKKMIHDDKERMMRCPSCGNMVFPRLVPAVIVGVRDGDRLLMTKYAGREYKRYALIAGFTEIGETMEETVSREVMEEVGLKVKNITYYKSQPWGFDSDLLLGFYCELDDDRPIRMDEDELSIAEWVDYKDIPDYHEGLSLTEEMMNVFKKQRRILHGEASATAS